MKGIRILTLFFMTFSLVSFTQQRAPKDIEKDLLKTQSKMLKQVNGNYDSLEWYSSRFSKQMTTLISANPATMDYPFDLLLATKKIQISQSQDGNLRIYSWDTELGGSMHLYNNLYQYKSGSNVYTEIPKLQEGDASGFFSEIHKVNSQSGSYYLGIKNGIYSAKDASQSVKAFAIQNSKLIDAVTLFKTKNENLNEIVCDFDFFSVVDHPERPLQLIRYDKEKQMLYIPVVTGEGQVTSRFLAYAFKDPYFVYVSAPKSESRPRKK